MSETESGYIPPPAPVEKPAAPLPRPAPLEHGQPPQAEGLSPLPEGEANRGKLLDGEMAGMQAMLLVDGTDTNKGIHKREIADIGHFRKPKAEKATKASRSERHAYWEANYKGTTKQEQERIWKDSANKYFQQTEWTDEQKAFLKNIGITDLDQGGDQMYQLFKQKGKGNLAVFAQAVARNNSIEQIEANIDLVKELATVYGSESSKVAVLLAEGIKNAQEHPEEFYQAATEQISQGKDMEGQAMLKQIEEGSRAWDATVKAERKRRLEEWQQNKAAKRKEKADNSRWGRFKKTLRGEKQSEETPSEEPEAKITDTEAAIKKAKDDAISTEELNKLRKKEDKNEALTDDEKKKLHAAEIKIASIEGADGQTDQTTMFENILYKLKDDPEITGLLKRNDAEKTIRDWVAHEQRHFQEMTESYTDVSYFIQFSKEGDKYKVHVSTHIGPPKDSSLSKEQRRDIDGKIAYAPGIGLDENDLAGMSKHDLSEIGFYEYKEDHPEGGEVIDAVKQARMFMNTEQHQGQISNWVEANKSHFDNNDELTKRQLCLLIASYNSGKDTALTDLSQL